MAESVPAIMAQAPARDNPLTRSTAGVLGMSFLGVVVLTCLVTLPWTLGRTIERRVLADGSVVLVEGSPRYDAQDRLARHLPPSWAFWGDGGRPRVDAAVDPATMPDSTAKRFAQVTRRRALERLAAERGGVTAEQLEASHTPLSQDQLEAARPFYILGTDLLGRDLFVRCLTGGGISLTVGIAAAFISVLMGTLYGAISAYAGGRVDAVMMRIVDILYGLPSILLVVLLAVAVEAKLDSMQAAGAQRATGERVAWIAAESERLPGAQKNDSVEMKRLETAAMVKFGSGEFSAATVQIIDLVTLLVAIGGVSWLTMARVIRGQVLSLKGQPFMEAARAMGAGVVGQFTRHLLPNLVGPITVYATLTVPQAVLQESALSFLGIGIRPPLPSWGNLAAEGLTELNQYKSNWWLLLFPCLLLGVTLLALNFVGEGLREALDPKRARRG